MAVGDVEVARVAARQSRASARSRPRAARRTARAAAAAARGRPARRAAARATPRSPTSARRSSAYAALSSASSGTSAKSGSPYQASRSANASFAHSTHGVDEVGPGAHRREVEAREQRELLEHHRPLPPRPGLADRVPVVVERHRRLERRLPAARGRRRVSSPRWRSAVESMTSVSRTSVDRLRHPAAVERVARRVDPRLARPARATARAARRRRPAAGCGTARPGARRRAGRSRPSSSTRSRSSSSTPSIAAAIPGTTGIAVARVGDRRRHHVRELPRAEVAQHQHPGVERARHDRRERPDARDQVEPARPANASIVARGRRRALAAQHPHLVLRLRSRRSPARRRPAR